MIQNFGEISLKFQEFGVAEIKFHINVETTEDDKNARFFHLQVNQRRKRNRITKLKKADGSLH